MKFLITATTLLCLVAIPPNPVAAQYFVNPGVKVGYTFGGGVTFGVEISVGYFEGGFAGVATGIDYTFRNDRKPNFFRIYFDVEGGFALLGTSVGTVLLFKQGKLYPGYQITPFLAIPLDYDLDKPEPLPILVPFYRRTVVKRLKPIHEVGFAYKISHAVGAGEYTKYNPYLH